MAVVALAMAAVVSVSAFAADAAEFHVTASIRKNIPTLQTSSPRFVFQVPHDSSFTSDARRYYQHNLTPGGDWPPPKTKMQFLIEI